MERYSTYCEEQDCPEPEGDYTRDTVSLELQKVSQLIRALSTVHVQMGFGNPYSPSEVFGDG